MLGERPGHMEPARGDPPSVLEGAARRARDTPLIVLPQVARTCDLCGSNDFKELLHLERKRRGKSAFYLFDNHLGICCHCSFVYVSPGYIADDLDRYYSDSFPNWLGIPTYSWERRLEFAASVGKQGGRLVEIGGNHDKTAREVLESHGFRPTFVETNADCGADFTGLGQLAQGQADVVAHYYVLEHMTDPKQFLERCRGLLKEDGLMICEVPDLDLYSKDAVEHLGTVEHLSHFSLGSLTELAGQCGFRLLSASRDLASKSCGFAAAFAKGAVRKRAPLSESFSSEARIREGAALIAAHDKNLSDLAERIQALDLRNIPCVIWGANEVSARLVDFLQRPRHVVSLDDDPAKSGYFPDVPVMLPGMAVDILGRAGLMISSRRHLAEKFFDRASALAGRSFASHELAVVDYGYCVSNYHLETQDVGP